MRKTRQIQYKLIKITIVRCSIEKKICPILRAGLGWSGYKNVAKTFNIVHFVDKKSRIKTRLLTHKESKYPQKQNKLCFDTVFFFIFFVLVFCISLSSNTHRRASIVEIYNNGKYRWWDYDSYGRRSSGSSCGKFG